jgi:hypothetical protein
MRRVLKAGILAVVIDTCCRRPSPPRYDLNKVPTPPASSHWYGHQEELSTALGQHWVSVGAADKYDLRESGVSCFLAAEISRVDKGAGWYLPRSLAGL